MSLQWQKGVFMYRTSFLHFLMCTFVGFASQLYGTLYFVVHSHGLVRTACDWKKFDTAGGL